MTIYFLNKILKYFLLVTLCTTTAITIKGQVLKNNSILWNPPTTDPRFSYTFYSKGVVSGGVEFAELNINNNTGHKLAVKVTYSITDNCGTIKEYQKSVFLKPNETSESYGAFFSGIDFSSDCKTFKELTKKIKTKIFDVQVYVNSAEDITEKEEEEKRKKEEEEARKKREAEEAARLLKEKQLAAEKAKFDALSERDKELALLKKRFEKEQADQAEKLKALQTKDDIALSELLNVQKNATAQTDAENKFKEEQAKIKAKYFEKVEKANSTYKALLEKVQAVADVPITPATDNFWNETVLPANYNPVQDKITGLWGYENREGIKTISSQYRFASPFNKGIAMVKLKNEDDDWAIIDSKGNTRKIFTKDYFNTLSTGSSRIRDFQFKAISEGVFIVDFYLEKYDRNSMGCIDRNGNIIIPPSFARIDSFVNGKSYAVKFINNETIKFNIDYWIGDFNANFNYSEFGTIDKTGRWVDASKSKMEYNYSYYQGFYIPMESNDPQQRERDRIEAENFKPVREQMYKDAMTRLETQVKQKVDAAKSRGFLVEKQK